MANLRRFVLGLIIALAFQIHPALAQSSDWEMKDFNSVVRIQSNGDITVSETIGATFLIPKHGIFRTIPFRYPTDNGSTISVPINVEYLIRNGESEPYTLRRVGDNIEIKIGDPDKEISGAQTYNISYTAKAAVNFFDSHDELYWNVTGQDWDVPLSQITGNVGFEEGVKGSFTQQRCLTGALGSTSENCSMAQAEDYIGFLSEGQPLTIVVGWPKGVVTKPDNYDQIRTDAASLNPFPIPWLWIVILNLGLPLIAFFFMLSYWLRHGRDPKGPGTVIAQYDPPAGMTPGEMGVLIDTQANHRDVIATMVDLAVRGYLTITEIEKKGVLGLQKSKDYVLDKTTPEKTGPTLKPHEQDLLNGLFASGDEVALSDLKGTFADDIKKIQSNLYTQVAAGGYFVRNPQSVRITFVILGVVLGAITFIAAAVGIFAFVPIGIMVIIFGLFMPQRTPKGAEAYWHAQGFKLFLEKAEKYRIHWQEKENIFEVYLPYAMAFGVADKWTKAFASLQQQPPNWYHGSNGTFNTLLLWSALNNFSAVSAKSFAPPAASGSSGFGGGGMSGGGFGGGGGGSW